MPTTPLAKGTMLTGVIPLLEEMGLDVDAILAEVGVPREDYGNPDARVPVSAAGRLLAAVTREGITNFGLELAARRKLSNWGPLGDIASNQGTLREAIEKVGAFMPIQVEGAHFRLVVGDDTSEVHCNLLYEIAWGALEQVVEANMAIMHRGLTEATAGGWRPLTVCLRHTRTAPAQAYARVFGTQVLFDQEFDGFLLLTADLHRRVSGSDPLAAGAAERNSRPLSGERQLAERVIELAILLLPDGRCSADEIADTLGLGVRTLQRRLADEEVTLGELIEVARQRMARAYVDSSNRPLSEVAVQLGFGSQAAFNHWYRGSFGVSPSARRRAVRTAQASHPGGLAETG
jgi:AraC-like DNA-binding protein